MPAVNESNAALRRRMFDPLQGPDRDTLREVLKRGLKLQIPLYNANLVAMIAKQLVGLGAKPGAADEDRTIGRRAYQLRQEIIAAQVEHTLAQDPLDRLISHILRR
jgi:hypothetical protein